MQTDEINRHISTYRYSILNIEIIHPMDAVTSGTFGRTRRDHSFINVNQRANICAAQSIIQACHDLAPHRRISRISTKLLPEFTMTIAAGDRCHV